jgi:predicted  nucleic acid-binding Zn-ribbon protein
MYQRLEALNSKLLALTAQFSSLHSDIDDLEDEFIELSKSLSDLSAELEAQTADVDDPDEILLAQIMAVPNTHKRFALMRRHGFVPRKAYVDGQHQRIWVRP